MTAVAVGIVLSVGLSAVQHYHLADLTSNGTQVLAYIFGSNHLHVVLCNCMLCNHNCCSAAQQY